MKADVVYQGKVRESLVEFWQGSSHFHDLSPNLQKTYLFKLLSLISQEARDVFACLLVEGGPLIIYELASSAAQQRLEGTIESQGLGTFFKRMALNDNGTPAVAYIQYLIPCGQVIRISNQLLSYQPP